MSDDKKITKFDENSFLNPPMSNRSIPFWSWNSTLDDKEKLRRQIAYFKEMGFGGFMMHSRIGLKSQYLGKDFMDAVKFCTEEAKKQGMYAWLYDEDRWPSGYAGGLVLEEDISLCIRFIQFTAEEEDATDSEAEGLAKGLTYFVAAYDVELDDDGKLLTYKRIGRYDEAKFKKWYAFSKRTKLTGWYNGGTFVDTLNPDAIKKFLEITHELYYKTVGEDFGETVPAIFFDEPSYAETYPMDAANGNGRGTIAWSHTLPKFFNETYGYDILDKLPEFFWQLPNGRLSQARYDIWDAIAERYAITYNDQIADWCRKHNIQSAGHYLREEELEAQMIYYGDIMRQYRSMDIPGIDQLGVGIPILTPTFRQARSVGRQYGRKDMICELYGISNYEFDFSTFKMLGDWNAVLGVTTRVPHLANLSMEGESKRDYPTSINYQAPWYNKFSILEDYFARLRAVLTTGKVKTNVAVVHPIESGWMLYGPNDQTKKQRDELTEHFLFLNKWLLTSYIDSDYLCEALISELCDCEQSASGLKVGEMTYQTVIVPDKTVILRKTTIEALNTLLNNGGNVIFIGDCPRCLDEEGSKLLGKVYAKAQVVPFDEDAILNALVKDRIIDILNENGEREERFFYQLREEEDRKWLFIVTGVLEKDPPEEGRKIKIVIDGKYQPKIYNPFDGSISTAEYEIQNGKTEIYYTFFAQDSLLLGLEPTEEATSNKFENIEENVVWSMKLDKEVEYSLNEPNVVLLDYAEYSVDGGEFRPKKDIIKISIDTKKELDLCDNGMQPWAIEDKPIEHSLSLRIKVNSEIDCDNVCLGIENPATTKMIWNGVEVTAADEEGWYIDEAIRKIRLPGLKKGENELVVTMPFGVKSWAENCYLLGDFGVKLKNPVTGIFERQDKLVADYGVKVISPSVIITEKTDHLTFGSVVTQGLPFYSANITYKFPIKLDESGTLRIKADRFVGALIGVSLDGEEKGYIINQPYTFDIDNVTAGEHKIELTVYGTRYNTLACLHLHRESVWNAEPGWYRTSGTGGWTDDYRFRECGLLETPNITLIKK